LAGKGKWWHENKCQLSTVNSVLSRVDYEAWCEPRKMKNICRWRVTGDRLTTLPLVTSHRSFAFAFAIYRILDTGLTHLCHPVSSIRYILFANEILFQVKS
jgi:hypothetical protein